MSMNREEESISGTESETRRLPYHAPRLVSLGSVQSLVQGVLEIGSDAGPGTDCAVFA